MVDCNKSRLYVVGDSDFGVPMRSASCAACEPRAHRQRLQPEWLKCMTCTKPAQTAKIVCNRDTRSIALMTESGESVTQIGCELSRTVGVTSAREQARLVLTQDVTIPPGVTMTLSLSLIHI